MKFGTAGLLAGAAALGGSGIAAACTSGNPSSSDIQTASFTSNEGSFSPSMAMADFFKLLQAEEAQETQAAPASTTSTQTANPHEVEMFLVALHGQEVSSSQGATSSSPSTDTSSTNASSTNASSTNTSSTSRCDGNGDWDDQGCAGTQQSNFRSGDDHGQGDDESHGGQGHHVSEHQGDDH